MKKTRQVKVRLGDVYPSPYRLLDMYPLKPRKMEVLAISIDRNGLWNNIIVRPHPKKRGKWEQVVGHHRWAAAIKVLGSDYVMICECADYDENDMVRMLADENDVSYSRDPADICEAVAAVQKLFSLDTGNIPSCNVTEKLNYSKEVHQITAFLGEGWNAEMVHTALTSIKLMKVGTLSVEAHNLCASQACSKELSRLIQQVEKAGSEVPEHIQVQLIEDVIAGNVTVKKMRDTGKRRCRAEGIDIGTIEVEEPTPDEFMDSEYRRTVVKLDDMTIALLETKKYLKKRELVKIAELTNPLIFNLNNLTKGVANELHIESDRLLLKS